MSNLFKSILGEQLSSVEFVQDYVQLHFDGPTITCYVWPKVVIGLNAFEINDDGYRDALCKIITHEVKEVILIEDDSLSVFFDADYKILISLIRNELTAGVPEFIYYRGNEDEWFVLD